MIRPALLLAAAALLTTSTARAAEPAGVDAARLSAITRVLASDEFEGRAPGTPGEAKTVDYLVAQFQALGLEPGGPDGQWTQAVPLIRTQIQPGAAISLTVGGKTQGLTQGTEVYLTSLRPDPAVKVEAAPMVFVGYGVSAPERGWDDFKGVDLKGKVAVVLINDPDFEAAEGDPVAGKFAGKAATFYARWVYKYEEAVRRGAAGVLIVHETPGAGYGWTTVTAPQGEGFDIVRADPAKEKLAVQGWMTRDLAVDLFRRSGLDFEALKLKARTAGFRPVALDGASFSAAYSVAVTRVESRNVIAKLTGAKRPDETVMFAAHWDAYGLGAPDAKGDPIRHGALDDAIGVAATLELARLFAAGPRPERTLVFAAWTAEERGLLGSEYYGVNPVYPHATMAANYTFDILQTAGPSRDVVLIGAGQNQLEDDLAAAARRQGRTVTPDAHPERALFYRADHFSLAKQGVPVLLLMAIGGGPDLVEGGRTAGDQWVSAYTADCYHKACDAWSADWDLRGAVADVTLIHEISRDLANSRRWPAWNAASEFLPIRERTAAERR